MNNVALLPIEQRRELFQEASFKLGMTPAIVEKDFWVTWVLHQLFADEVLAQQLMFKGGTSLSKVYGVIERFSEDIDLILDWRVLTESDPMMARSKTKDAKLSKDMNAEAVSYIADELLSKLSEVVWPVCQCRIENDPFVVNIQYPGVFSDEYLRPEIRLEIGPMAAWTPYEQHSVTTLVVDVFPDLITQSACVVNVIKAKRTFWEKATILHHEAHRPKQSPLPLRYSRHYYDLAMMANTDIKQQALADLALLTEVVEFKQRFYARGWANYEQAVPGTFKLIPEQHVMDSIKRDYADMKTMVYGKYPPFGDIMNTLTQLEEEINGLDLLL